MGVSENSGTPKSSILIGGFHYKPSILGYPYFWKHPHGGWTPSLQQPGTDSESGHGTPLTLLFDHRF